LGASNIENGNLHFWRHSRGICDTIGERGDSASHWGLWFRVNGEWRSAGFYISEDMHAFFAGGGSGSRCEVLALLDGRVGVGIGIGMGGVRWDRDRVRVGQRREGALA